MDKSIRWNRKLGYVVPESTEKDFQHYEHDHVDDVNIGISSAAVLCGFKLIAILVVLTLPLAIDSLIWLYKAKHYARGETGLTGILGPEGLVGHIGHTGPQGIRGLTGFPGLPRDDVGTGSSSYVHWGRSGCSNTSEMVYSGSAAGGREKTKGSIGNYLCLPELPQYDGIEPGVQDNRNFINGVFYKTAEFLGHMLSLTDHQVPCALCLVRRRGVTTVHPARETCMANWTMEYSGYLMGARMVGRSSRAVCVDRDAETNVMLPYRGQDVAVFAAVGPNCASSGNMPCPPYVHRNKLACSVCSI